VYIAVDAYYRYWSSTIGSAISSNDGERGHGLRDPLHADSLDLEASAFDVKEDIYQRVKICVIKCSD
jgi:hypothetical protein